MVVIVVVVVVVVVIMAVVMLVGARAVGGLVHVRGLGAWG